MGNQQPRLEQSKVQRLSRKGVDLQAIGKSKWCASFFNDEDIVCTHIRKIEELYNSVGSSVPLKLFSKKIEQKKREMI